jgi:hypothetical protein
LENIIFAPLDVCPATANLLTSTQALRPQHVSSALKIPDYIIAHQSGRSDPPVRPVRCCCTSVLGSSVLALWINQGTQWFSGEAQETPRTWCSLLQSPLMTGLPHSPGSTLVLRLNQQTIHDFILLFLPPSGPHLAPLAIGSLKPCLLVFSTPESSPATTFRACSSPAPTPVKPQPAPVVLSQESVHTMLSITHHTWKRPSTGPRTPHISHDVLMIM